ncbi:MAG: Gfo/Idh/MocA family oxidoreductase [Planctomycetaceae bacterium]|nr:Gfo/Idh/MocA family oxidoreductase [Planctomycetaceae bacterium]
MKLSRRTFLKATAATPFVVPSSVLGRDGNTAPSERVTMGLIGCGSHGIGWNLPLMFANPMQQVIAVHDVDKPRALDAQKRVNAHYSEKMGQSYAGCEIDDDFRDLVNRKEIDAVCIATPDHWHVLLSVFAMKAGKDVICEKPTWSIREGRILADTARQTGRVYQTASENRSIDVYQQIVNLCRGGHLGEIRHMKVLLPPGNTGARNPNKDADPSDAPQEVPEGLDYDTWTGPAPLIPYIPIRHHYNWRWNFAYSGGLITDWGAHLVNIAQWCIDADETGPVSVQAEGEMLPEEAIWNTPANFKAYYQYANGVKLDIWTEVPGIKVEGTKGWILSRGWRGPLRSSDDKLLEITFEGPKNFGRPESTVAATSGTGGEHIDFANCVKSRGACYYTAESGHRTHTIAHLANVSMLLGGVTLKWNPAEEKFEGDHAEAPNRHFCYERSYREPWTFEKIDSWINVG